MTETAVDCSPAREPRYDREQILAFGLDPQRLPRHIAVIMDGNGRWARARNQPRIEGHRQGVHSVRFLVTECARLGVEQLTLYCLSSENWKRPPDELELLMELLEQYVIEERPEIMRQGLQFGMIGQREGLSKRALAEIDLTTSLSAANDGMRLCLAVNYGSRAEITHAVRRIAEQVRTSDIAPADITEETIADHLDTAGMPDPDLIIRTAGEMRVSNFLLWQISYAELFVTETHWPDFRQAELIAALQSYARRDRRYGGLKE